MHGFFVSNTRPFDTQARSASVTKLAIWSKDIDNLR